MRNGERYTPEHLRPVHEAVRAFVESYLGPGSDTGLNDFCWDVPPTRAIWLWGNKGTGVHTDPQTFWLEVSHAGGKDWGFASMEDFENQKADIAADLARIAILLAQ